MTTNLKLLPSTDRPEPSYSNTASTKLYSSESNQSNVWDFYNLRTLLRQNLWLFAIPFDLSVCEFRDDLEIRYHRKPVWMSRRCNGFCKNDFNLDNALCCKVGLIPQRRMKSENLSEKLLLILGQSSKRILKLVKMNAAYGAIWPLVAFGRLIWRHFSIFMLYTTYCHLMIVLIIAQENKKMMVLLAKPHH